MTTGIVTCEMGDDSAMHYVVVPDCTPSAISQTMSSHWIYRLSGYRQGLVVWESMTGPWRLPDRVPTRLTIWLRRTAVPGQEQSVLRPAPYGEDDAPTFSLSAFEFIDYPVTRYGSDLHSFCHPLGEPAEKHPQQPQESIPRLLAGDWFVSEKPGYGLHWQHCPVDCQSRGRLTAECHGYIMGDKATRAGTPRCGLAWGSVDLDC